MARQTDKQLTKKIQELRKQMDKLHDERERIRSKKILRKHFRVTRKDQVSFIYVVACDGYWLAVDEFGFTPEGTAFAGKNIATQMPDNMEPISKKKFNKAFQEFIEKLSQEFSE